jgi:hypothetical protein
MMCSAITGPFAAEGIVIVLPVPNPDQYAGDIGVYGGSAQRRARGPTFCIVPFETGRPLVCPLAGARQNLNCTAHARQLAE